MDSEEGEEENEESILLVGEEGNRIIDGIKRTGEDLYRGYLAPIGDISPTHPVFLGVSPLGKKD